MVQSYEIKLPSQAFLDGRSSPWIKFRQVGCYDVAKFRLVTIDSCALIHSCVQIWALLHHNTQPVLIFNRQNLQNFKSQNGPMEVTWFHSFVLVWSLGGNLECSVHLLSHPWTTFAVSSPLCGERWGVPHNGNKPDFSPFYSWLICGH